jgi:hypothetical protein
MGIINIIFSTNCSEDHSEVAKWLFRLDHKIDIHANNE